jgi:hypothetical protein
MSLKPHQIDLLRAVCNRGSVPASEIDGRGLQPLLRLELVVDDNFTIRPTEKGRSTARADLTAIEDPAGRGSPARSSTTW